MGVSRIAKDAPLLQFSAFRYLIVVPNSVIHVLFGRVFLLSARNHFCCPLARSSSHSPLLPFSYDFFFSEQIIEEEEEEEKESSTERDAFG